MNFYVGLENLWIETLLKFNSEWFVGLLQILITKKRKITGLWKEKMIIKLDLEAHKNEGINGIELFT